MTVEIIQLGDITDEIQDILVEYTETVSQGITTVGYDAAVECRKKLKTESPKKSGAYARGWKISKQKGRPGEPTSYIVHNEDHYRLTHLLEKGHLIKRNGKVVGRAPAHAHIAPVEESVIRKFTKDVEDVIRGNQ